MARIVTYIFMGDVWIFLIACIAIMLGSSGIWITILEITAMIAFIIFLVSFTISTLQNR